MISELFSGSVWPWLIVQATFCIAAGLAASFLLRRSAARAHQVLLAALAAAVFAPAVFVLVSYFQLGVLPSQPAPVSHEVTEPLLSFDAPAVDLPVMEATYEEPAAAIPASRAVARAPLPWKAICLGGWIGLSAILLGRLILRFVLGLRLLRMAHPVTGEPLQRALEAAKVRLDIDGPIRIRCSARIKSPIIWCWTRRPVLLVHGQAAEGLDNVDWAGVFCHELAHLKRRDHLSGLFTELLTALVPWHPLLWLAAARLAQLSEQACDDWVLAGGQSGVDYAETLLGLAAQRQMAFVPTVIGKERTMKARIHRIIKDRCGDPRVGTRWAAGVVILAVLAVVSVGFAQRRPVARPEREVEVPGQPPRPEQDRAATPEWQRRVLERKLDELAGQIREKEALLRERGDMPQEERRTQEFELYLLREMTAQIERRLRDQRQSQAQMLEHRRELDEQFRNLGRERAELSRVRRQLDLELRGLEDRQGAEANELQDRLRELQERERQTESMMADIGRTRQETNQQIEDTQRQMEQEYLARGGTRAREIAEQQRDRDRAAAEQTLRDRVSRYKEIEKRLDALLGGTETDETRKMKDAREQVGMSIREAEERLGQLEREGARPDPEPQGRGRRRAADDPYGDMYGNPYSAQPRERAGEPGGGNLVTRIYKLERANPERTREIVQSLLGESGQITADERTGSLIVTTTNEKHQSIEEVLRRLDTPSDDRGLRREVDDIRSQMNGLREQIQEMHKLLEQTVQRERTELKMREQDIPEHKVEQ